MKIVRQRSSSSAGAGSGLQPHLGMFGILRATDPSFLVWAVGPVGQVDERTVLEVISRRGKVKVGKGYRTMLEGDSLDSESEGNILEIT